jgi:hypothetical protein
MWVFTDRGFLSIVEHRDDPETLLVRSRFAGQIRKLFPGAKVLKTPQADYLYRAFIPRRQVADKLFSAVEEIHYPNFKNSIGDDRYHDACMDVWSALYRHQRRT